MAKNQNQNKNAQADKTPVGATSDAPNGGAGANVESKGPGAASIPNATDAQANVKPASGNVTNAAPVSKEGEKAAAPGIPGLAEGRIVHFYREVANTAGKKLERRVGIVVDIASPVNSSFKPMDGAATIFVFSKNGAEGAGRHHHNILFSEVPTDGRWTFPPKV